MDPIEGLRGDMSHMMHLLRMGGAAIAILVVALFTLHSWLQERRLKRHLEEMKGHLAKLEHSGNGGQR